MPVTSLIILAVLGQPPSAWTAKTVKAYIGRINMAAGLANGNARDTELLLLAGQAYQTARKANESAELYARRTIKHLDPGHPRVKKGQWLLALTKRFYEDIASRCESLARFERRRKDKVFFAENAKAFRRYVSVMSSMLRISIKGVDGEIEPLSIAKGRTKKVHGVQVTVTGENISIEQSKRVTFENNQAAPDANRTARGSLMGLFNSFRQHHTYGKLMARSKRKKNKDLGKIRLFIPATKPSTYFNELVRAAKEAKYSRAYLMVFLPKTAQLAHLELLFSPPTKKDLRRNKYAKAQCQDDESMQACATHLAELQATKKRLYIE